MSTTTLVLWAAAGALWVYALVPLTRIKRYFIQQRRDGLVPPSATDAGQMRGILRNAKHPLHRDARRMMVAYGCFLFCWIVGFALTLGARPVQ